LVVLAALVAAGAVLRFVTRSPLWLDEALSVNLAELPVADLASALRHDGHPGLYYVVLGVWIDLFGNSDAAVRALSGVASLAAVPVLWAATRRRFGTRAAFHVAALAATSPFFIRYGSESRMYAMVALTTAAGWWAIEAARERPTWPRLAVVAAVAAVAVNTHYWMIWLVGTVLVLALLAWCRGPTATRQAALRIGAAVGLGAATFVVWLPVFVEQAAHTGTPWADRARPAEIAVETVEGLGGGMRFEPVLLGIALVVMAVLGTFAVETTRDRVSLGTRVPSVAAGVVAVAALTLVSGGAVAIISGTGFEARYAAVVIPLLVALAARGTSFLPPRAGLAALVLLASMGLAVSVDDARRDRTQGEDVAAIIDEQAQSGDVVVFCPDQLAPATIRSLRHDGPRFTYPPTDDPRFVDWYDYADRIAAADPVQFAADVDAAAGDEGIWLVFMTSYRGFDARCETIASVLGTGRPQQTVLVGSTAFEPMFLQHFGAAS
jgi:hypothetical protein